MAPKATENSMNKGAWTPEEDSKLAQFIEIHGAKKWKTIAAKAGLNRCGKSCRLRWLNYLRPNIKRGSFSEQEEDLILRLHKLLGNRWSLIAGRLPGRTDNDIKNYWNSHLSKKKNQKEKQPESSITQESESQKTWDINVEVNEESEMRSKNLDSSFDVDEESKIRGQSLDTSFDVDDLFVDNLFDFSIEGSFNLDWVNNFLELDGNLDFLEISVVTLQLDLVDV